MLRFSARNIWTTRSSSSYVDDMARLIAWILRREPEAQRLTILNVAGRGDPLTFGQCIEMAHAKLLRVPGEWGMRRVLQLLMELEYLGDSSRCRALYDRPVHHEHRPPEDISWR